MAEATTGAAPRGHYGWVVVGITFLTLLAAAGVRASAGVLIVPLEQEFGWDRATISAAISLNLLLYGLIGPFGAALVEKVGLRRIMVLALVLTAIGPFLSLFMTRSWQLVLLQGLVVGTGTGLIALTLGAVVVNRWFAERRGLAMGLLTASTATGQLVFLPMLASLVESHGWRWAAGAVAAVAAAMVPVVLLFMRNRPSDLGLRPYGETGAATAAPAGGGNALALAVGTLSEGVRTRNFWLLAASFFICGASTNGLIGTHLIAACMDQGIPEVGGASLLAAMGCFDLVGTTLSGWLSDRFNNRVLLFWYYGLRGLSLIFLPYAFGLSLFDFSLAGLSLFAMFYGLDWIATVPPTVRLTADIYGKQKAGIMFGWIVAGHQVGAAFAAAGAGLLRADLGRYLEAFMIAGLLCLVASVVVLAIGRRRATPALAAA